MAGQRRYAAEIMLTAERRRPGPGKPTPPSGATLRRFVREDEQMRQRSRPVPSAERPPARSVRP